MNELVAQWRQLRDKIVKGTDDPEDLGILLETGDLLVQEIEHLRAYQQQMNDILKESAGLRQTLNEVLEELRLADSRHDLQP